jgi:hypothetical protein
MTSAESISAVKTTSAGGDTGSKDLVSTWARNSSIARVAVVDVYAMRVRGLDQRPPT